MNIACRVAISRRCLMYLLADLADAGNGIAPEGQSFPVFMTSLIDALRFIS